jgi:hypothetical protein
MKNNEGKRPQGELLVYQGQGIDEPIQVRLEGETVWLNQKLMAKLYGTSVPNINQHISAIYEDEELLPEATIKKYLIVQTEGSRQVKRLVMNAESVNVFIMNRDLSYDSSFWSESKWILTNASSCYATGKPNRSV